MPLVKIFEKSKTPAPPLPKALLLPALGGVGRALPSLSSAFGRAGAGVLDFLKIFTRGISHTHMRASVT